MKNLNTMVNIKLVLFFAVIANSLHRVRRMKQTPKVKKLKLLNR
jgi:hypothetical protein